MSLEKARKRCGLSQVELARKSGVSASQICRIESGEIDIRNITIHTAIALAKALDMTINELVEAAAVQKEV